MSVSGGFARVPMPAERIGQAFVALADTMAEDFELAAYLRRLISLAQDLLGADGVGVMLNDPSGRLRVAAASSPSVERLVQAELAGGDGPGLVAYRTGKAVAHVRLDPGERRWSALAASAWAAGFRCAHAIPLRRGDEVIGGLSLFSRADQPLSQPGQLLGRALADQVTISLLHHRALSAQRLRAAQLQQAFTTRVAIEQAKGVLAERHDIPLDVAFDQMRAQARKTNRKLADLAQEILGDAALTPPVTPAADRRRTGGASPATP
ncbi:ANTAR domain-containing protein [Actinoplanes sp. HUAS TT8]|uniref:ANTAR domain-containing protein n=1 Tax=Actinoplanes sp. HUAS TT8 TaxID=3447453 RepID=UPI003F5275C6